MSTTMTDMTPTTYPGMSGFPGSSFTPFMMFPTGVYFQNQTPDQRLDSASSISFGVSSAFFSLNGPVTLAAYLENGQPLPSWLGFDPASGQFSGTVPDGTTATRIKVIGTSPTDGSHANEGFTIYGTPGVPRLVEQTLDVRGHPGELISTNIGQVAFGPSNGNFTVAMTQADGSALPSWLTFNAQTGALTGFLPKDGGTTRLVVTATNPSGAATSEAFSIYDRGSAPKLVTQQDDVRVSAGSAFSGQLAPGSFSVASGVPTLAMTRADGSALPSWMSFDPATGKFSGTAPATATNQRFVVTATGPDGQAAAQSFVVYGQAAAPTLVHQQDDIRVGAGSAFSVTVPQGSFADPAGGAVTLAVTQADGSALPSWASFDSATGTISGTAPGGVSTTQAFVVTGTTASGGTAAEAFHLYGSTLALGTQASDVFTADGSQFSYTLPPVAHSQDGSACLVSAQLDTLQALPSWLSFDAATSKLSGTVPFGNVPDSLGIRIDATDASGGHVAEAFHIYVQHVDPA